MRGRAALLPVVAAAALAAGCVSARDCAGAIREDLRADAIRLAIDKGLVPEELVPREDYALARGLGRSYKVLSAERLDEISGPAAGYASCILERMSR